MKVIYATASVMRAKFLTGSYISTHAALKVAEFPKLALIHGILLSLLI